MKAFLKIALLMSLCFLVFSARTVTASDYEFPPQISLPSIEGIGTQFTVVRPDGSIITLNSSGNYWSDWTSPDYNKDGFVDYCYTFYYNTTDYFPWTRQNGWFDTTAPETTAVLTGTEGHNGWYISDVEVILSATDEGSGVDRTEYSLDGTTWHEYTGAVTLAEDGVYTLSYRSTDLAGNTAEGVLEIKIDQTPPEITGFALAAPNAHGWYNSDVTVNFEASDSVSGLETVTPVTVLSTEGEGQSVTGTATDLAGNSASYMVTGINIDKTAPEVTITLPEDGGEYLLNEVIFVNWSAYDALSGLAEAEGTQPPEAALDTARQAPRPLQ